jgi:hypothetical protein
VPTALVSTAGAANANTYASLSDATTYFGDRLFSDTWNNATADQKTQALLWATKVLDTRVQWKGVRSSGLQALDWPRTYVLNPDWAGTLDGEVPGSDLDVYLPGDTIPAFLKWAQCEQALALLTEDITLDPGTKGFSSISLPGLSFQIDKLDARSVLPSSVTDIIKPYGTVRASASSGFKTARLLRA